MTNTKRELQMDHGANGLARDVSSVNRERQRQRRAQAKAVMPLIGPLLDAYEGLPGDLATDESMVELAQHLDAISEAMENAGDE